MKDHYQSILSAWDIGQVGGVEWLKDSVGLITVLSGNKFVLKQEQDATEAERVGRMARLLAALDADGVPVLTPIPNRQGHLLTVAMGKCFCLYPFVEWTDTSKTVGDPADRVRATGAAIAQLHLALKRHENLAVMGPMNLVDDVRKWALPRMRSNALGLEVAEAVEILDRIAQEIPQVCGGLPEQLIHRDSHQANILLREDCTVVSFVDFEMARRGPRVYDLCYCCTDMLGNAPSSASGTRMRDGQEWGQMVRGLLDGYQQVITLAEAEKRAMWHIMLVIQGAFIAWFCQDACERANYRTQWADSSCVEWATKNLRMLLWLHANRAYVDQLARA
ncbi:MAG: phosphotransferase [Phycisphaerae bacterium]|jgi:Ser/Thr protein kinase RdoA (MazF antagonist)